MANIEKKAILEIVRISLKNEYSTYEEVAEAKAEFFGAGELAESGFGKRYLERLNLFGEPEFLEGTCILCQKNLAGNGVVCGECIGNLLPVLSNEDDEPEEKKTQAPRVAPKESAKPDEIAFALKQIINEIQTANDKGFVSVDIVSEGCYKNIFFDTERFRCINKFDGTDIGYLNISHIYHRTIEVNLTLYQEQWWDLFAKVLIELMEPAHDESQIEEIYDIAMREEEPYFYRGLYYEGEISRGTFSFSIGTEEYEAKISDNVRRANVKPDYSLMDLFDLFYMEDQQAFISKFQIRNNYGDEEVLDRVIRITRYRGKMQSVRIEGYTDYTIKGLYYGQDEYEVAEILENICSHVYKDSTLGYKSRYKYKAKFFDRGQEFRLEVFILCGHVWDIFVSHK